MKKWIIRIVMLVVLAIFLFSVTSVVLILHQYEESDKLYSQTAERFTMHMAQNAENSGSQGEEAQSGEDSIVQPEILEVAPFTVDFQGLQAVNGDVCGWIYCEGTPIDYPVVQGEDNGFYLRHSYDRTYNASGSIFADIKNAPNFADSNTIIYGHNMNNGSMFNILDNWAEQEYYEEHPVMWLLTPEQDYKIVLFSGYTTSATSDTYTIFDGPCQELNTYLARSKEQSDFIAEEEPDGDSRYVLLSTCAYVFDNARYVLHGKLVPVDSAGGVPLR